MGAIRGIWILSMFVAGGAALSYAFSRPRQARQPVPVIHVVFGVVLLGLGVLALAGAWG